MEKSSFTLVFGESPFVKVLDFFIEFEDFDYPISFISKETETKWETVEKIVEVLIRKGLVKKTRKLGKAWLYGLNKESKLTKLLIDIDKNDYVATLNSSLNLLEYQQPINIIKYNYSGYDLHPTRAGFGDMGFIRRKLWEKKIERFNYDRPLLLRLAEKRIAKTNTLFDKLGYGIKI